MDKPTYEELEAKVKFLEERNERQESFLNMLFDTIPNPIFYKDNQGIYQHCNDAFAKTILGISKEEIIGKSLYDIPDRIPKELADIYYEKDQELFNNGGMQNYESKVKCSDNVERDYHFYKAAFLSQSQKVLGIVGVMLDISEYKKVLKELNIKNEILSELSIEDPLTRLYNRRYFEKIFARKKSLLMHHNQPFAFMFADIDFFKDYNDTFGHAKGDDVLTEIAHIFKKSFLRPIDFIFRLGGEEFGILFNFNTVPEALERAEKLRKDIENLKIPAGNTTVSNYVTISAGLGLVNPTSDKKNKLSHLYEDVDKLLYKAKNSGRNKLVYEVYNL